MLSLRPVTVTVWGVFQLLALKVSVIVDSEPCDGTAVVERDRHRIDRLGVELNG